MKPEGLLGIREYARHRKVHHKAVQKAIEAGRISVVLEPDGSKWIDPKKADVEWLENTDPGHRESQSRGVDEQPSVEGLSKFTLKQSKEWNAELSAKLKELEYRRKKGELMVASDVIREQMNWSRAVRDMLLQIPARVAGPTRRAKTDSEAETILMNEIVKILETFVESNRR